MEGSRVVIIGAGPAGIRCAQMLVDAGLTPVVIDEQPRSGGQIYRRQPPNFKRGYKTLYGSEAAKAQALHRSADRIESKILYYPNTSVWNVQDKIVYAHQDGQPLEIHYDSIVLCTGAIDRVMPIEGWQNAGSYTLGGAQVALKYQGLSIGEHVTFMGSGPLLYLVAYQYVKAGADVKAVLDTSTLKDRCKGLMGLLSKPQALWAGLYFMLQMKRAGVALYSGITPQRIAHDEQGVCGVEAKLPNGKNIQIHCDAVATGFHLKPETQLADLLGCDFSFDELSQLWLLNTDGEGRTSVPHVYSAGDGTAILGADAAECAGRLAALSLLQDLDPAAMVLTMTHNRQKALKQKMLKKLAQFRRFGLGLQKAFPWPAHMISELTNETVVCRCEMIKAGEIKQSVRYKQADEVNRSKSFTRVGMGRCQGRYCEHVNRHLIAKASQHNDTFVGRQRSQAPVKPLPVDVYVHQPQIINQIPVVNLVDERNGESEVSA